MKILCKLVVVIVVLSSPLTSRADLYFPHLELGSDRETRIGIINTCANQVLEGELAAFDSQGNEVLSRRTLRLSANQRREIIYGSPFLQVPDLSYLVFKTSSTSVAGYARYHGKGSFSAAVPAQTPGS